MAPNRSALRTLNFLALAALLAVGAFHFGQASASRTSEERRRTAVVDAVKHAAPAVVSVSARSGGRRVWTEGAGAGVIVHPAGYVVTNSHVVKGARTIYVELFRNGGNYRCDKILDRPRGDLALLKIRTEGKRKRFIMDGHAVKGVSGGPVWHFNTERQRAPLAAKSANWWRFSVVASSMLGRAK